MNQIQRLSPEDLASLDAETTQSLLSYLNLPRVGAMADREGPPDLDVNQGMEIETALRRALREQRDRIGGFASPESLLGVPGFGSRELRQMVSRLGDLGRYGNRARPVWGGPDGERELFALLEGAERYIHISTFIVGGNTGMRLVELLARKMREGVDVRLMFCATGFVISGSPSGTGFASSLSELRSYLLNDMYVRKHIVRALNESGVPYVNNVPIGRHWTRRDIRRQGIRTEAAYYGWQRQRGLKGSWLDQQKRIDAVCGPTFANVDHRKMVIVDGDRAFMGSQNLADSYFYSHELSMDPKVNRRNWEWQDNSTILEGPCVRDLERLFAERWMLCGGNLYDPEESRFIPPLKRAGNAVVTLEKSIPGMLQVPLRRNLARMVASAFGAYRRPIHRGQNPIRNRIRQLPGLAQHDFYAEHCYPSDADLLGYWTAAARDIEDFTMVVPRHYDTKVLGFECDRCYPEMIDGGVRLHGYDRAIMHAKIAVVDGYYVATGSYNLTLRSGRADLENEIFVQCPECGEAVRDYIRKDMEHSVLIEPTPVDRYRAKHSLPIFDVVVRYLLL